MFLMRPSKDNIESFSDQFLEIFGELSRPIQLGLAEEKLEKGKEQLCAMCQIGSNCLRAKS